MLIKRKGSILTMETVICLFVFSVLGTIGIYNLSDLPSRVNTYMTVSDMKELLDAHVMYYAKNKTFASENVLVNEKYIFPDRMWNGSKMVDRWGNPVITTINSNSITLTISETSKKRATSPIELSFSDD